MNENIQNAKALFAPVPRVQLGFFPTPFYKLERMSKELGVNLYIKRDDFTGMNLFGGNKIRKLEFLRGDADGQGGRRPDGGGAAGDGAGHAGVLSPFFRGGVSV